MAFKMKGPMFFGSAIKKYGKKSEPMMKKETGEDTGAKPDYIDLDGDGDKNESMKKAASDKQGSGMNYGKKMKPAPKMHKTMYNKDKKDEKGGPKMKYGKPAPKMVHGGKDKKGGPKMKKDNFEPHMMYKDGKSVKANTYEKHLSLKKDGYTHKKQGKSLNQVNINQK